MFIILHANLQYDQRYLDAGKNFLRQELLEKIELGADKMRMGLVANCDCRGNNGKGNWSIFANLTIIKAEFEQALDKVVQCNFIKNDLVTPFKMLRENEFASSARPTVVLVISADTGFNDAVINVSNISTPEEANLLRNAGVEIFVFYEGADHGSGENYEVYRQMVSDQKNFFNVNILNGLNAAFIQNFRIISTGFM